MSKRTKYFFYSMGLLAVSGVLSLLWKPLGVAGGLGTLGFFFYYVILDK